MSYTLYITHYATIKLYQLLLIELGIVTVGEKNTNSIAWFIAVFVCVFISYVFYMIVEHPTKNVLKRLRK